MSLKSFVWFMFVIDLTYLSNGDDDGSVAVRQSDDETSTVDESMLVRFTAVIMF